MKQLVNLFILVLALVAGGLAYWYGPPMLAARAFQQAVVAGDKEAIEAAVDFEAFRAQLRDELPKAAEARIDGSQAGGIPGLGRLGGALTGLLSGPLVGHLATPDGISKMAQGYDALDPEFVATRAELEATLSPRFSRTELKRFELRFVNKETDEISGTFLFEKQPEGWVVVGIDLTDD